MQKSFLNLRFFLCVKMLAPKEDDEEGPCDHGSGDDWGKTEKQRKNKKEDEIDKSEEDEVEDED